MAFPAALIKVLPTPLAAEFRGFRPSKDRIGRHALAGWCQDTGRSYSDYGITRAQIGQREKRRRARRRAIATTVTGTVMVMLISLTVSALVERPRGHQATQRRGVSPSSHTSRTISWRRMPDTALLLAAAAYRNASHCGGAARPRVQLAGAPSVAQVPVGAPAT